MNTNVSIEERLQALRLIREQLAEATQAKKCHGCGCFQQTTNALSGTQIGVNALADSLTRAHEVFTEKKYDCLGCAVCFPAVAANAFTLAFPEEGAQLELCPTDIPEERKGWPPLPGDYHVLQYGAPVAVCTLNSEALTARLWERAPQGMGIVGTLHTENLGIERIIQNTLQNPNLRFLLLCGEDTRQAIGHLPGQSLQSLFQNGIDENGRIIGARGKRPLLKNVTRNQVEAFVRQVELVPLLGEYREEPILARLRECVARDPGPFAGAPVSSGVAHIQASEPSCLVLDPAGFFVVYPDLRRKQLMVEHYTNAGVLSCVLTGQSPAALVSEVIERGLISRLDHAAYLGRELWRAERSLATGEPYVQDRAPGAFPAPKEPIKKAKAGCGCGTSCEPGGVE